MTSQRADIAEAFLQIHLSKTLDPSVEFDMAALSIDDAYAVQRDRKSVV